MKRIIPFGDHCATASVLRDLGLRECAYPFDWIMFEYDKNAFEWYLYLIRLILDGKSPECVAAEFLAGTDFYYDHINSMGYHFSHETGTSQEIFDKYTRRFSRLKDHITNDECTFVICTRFTPLQKTIDDMSQLLPRHKCIVITGVNETLEGVKQITIPYDRNNVPHYDYSYFRPQMKIELNAIFNPE
jgi:hypothetical protein